MFYVLSLPVFEYYFEDDRLSSIIFEYYSDDIFDCVRLSSSTTSATFEYYFDND
jgi:hypothetical protein